MIRTRIRIKVKVQFLVLELDRVKSRNARKVSQEKIECDARVTLDSSDVPSFSVSQALAVQIIKSSCPFRKFLP